MTDYTEYNIKGKWQYKMFQYSLSLSIFTSTHKNRQKTQRRCGYPNILNKHYPYIEPFIKQILVSMFGLSVRFYSSEAGKNTRTYSREGSGHVSVGIPSEVKLWNRLVYGEEDRSGMILKGRRDLFIFRKLRKLGFLWNDDRFLTNAIKQRLCYECRIYI